MADDRKSVLEHMTMCKMRYTFPNEKDNNMKASATLMKVTGWGEVLHDIA